MFWAILGYLLNVSGLEVRGLVLISKLGSASRFSGRGPSLKLHIRVITVGPFIVQKGFLGEPSSRRFGSGPEEMPGHLQGVRFLRHRKPLPRVHRHLHPELLEKSRSKLDVKDLQGRQDAFAAIVGTKLPPTRGKRSQG